MRRFILMLVVLGVVATLPVHAQAGSIDPGMSRAEVIERLGKPVGERQSGQFRYLFYRNGCEVRCGMQDLVILQDDMVVDAVFRSPNHTFTGASSSPAGVTPEAGGAKRSSEGGGTVKITPTTESGSTDRSGGGIVTGTPAPAPVVPKPAPTSPQPATSPTSTTARPAGNPMTAGPTTGGAPSATVPPLSPRDTTNVQPNRTTQGQLTPATKDAQPIPFSGSKPNPRDSAEKARAGQKPDSIKPPED